MFTRYVTILISSFCALLLAGAQGEDSTPPVVSAFIDYAGSSQTLTKLVTDGDLHRPRARYRDAVNAFRTTCRDRGREREVDRSLAALAYDIGDDLLAFIADWEKYQEDLDRIRNFKGLLKTSDAERDKREREERIARQTENLERRWEQHATDLRRRIDGRSSTLQEQQEKFNLAIQRRLIVVQAPGQTSRPVPPVVQPPARNTPPPPPEPEYDVGNFKLPERAVKVSDTNLKTPDHLLPLVRDTAEWLNVQQRRIGGQLVTRMYGDMDEGRSYLYLQTTDLFNRLGESEKSQFGSAIQHYWGMKCTHSGKVPSEKSAHIVMMNDRDEVLVTSDSTNATWVRVLR